MLPRTSVCSDRPCATAPPGDAIYVGDAHEATVCIRNANGRRTRESRWLAPLVRVTPVVIERFVSGGRPEDMSAQQREERKPSFYVMPAQDMVPAFLRMLVDPVGRIWLEDFPVAGLGTDWTVLNADGSLLGRIELPRPAGSNARDPVQLIEVLEDRVALKWLDDDGAVHRGYFKLERS